MTLKPYTVQEALTQARRRLKGQSETAGLDAQVLLAQVMGKDRAWVLAHGQADLSRKQAETYEAALARLEDGEALPYVLGEWEFYGLKFKVTPDVLIPRPETELLVERALEWLRANPRRRKVVDVGTGSGCIAIALAVNVPDLRVLATDISHPALQIARSNAARNHVQTRIDLLQADLLQPAGGRFDLVCANLPYVPTETLRGLKVYGREPTVALDGGAEGLDFIQRLLEDAPRMTAAGGRIMLEIEAGQGVAVRRMSGQVFPRTKIEVIADLAGHPRLLVVDL